MVLTFFLGLQLLPISEVTRVSWWMAHYGGLSPKRHYAWSNSPAIKRLDKGRLQWKKLKATLPYTIETVKKYVDSENRTMERVHCVLPSGWDTKIDVFS